MQIITLTKGLETIVDDDMYDELRQYLWYASGLKGRPARRLRDSSHKLIYIYHQIMRVNPWELKAKNMCVHHINHNPLDNQKANLEVATIAYNNYNKSKGFIGISHDYTNCKWKAYIDRPYQKRYNVGTFRSFEEAQEALQEAKMEMGLENN